MSNQNIEQYLLKVQIFSTSRIDERSGVSEKTGKDWFILTQEAYILVDGGEKDGQIASINLNSVLGGEAEFAIVKGKTL